MANQRIRNLMPQVVPLELQGDSGPKLTLLQAYQVLVVDPSRVTQDLTDKSNAKLGGSNVRVLDVSDTTDPVTPNFGALGE
jgi:hypothetical protein